ncbi:MAG TPA: hypothetical protein VES20_00450, partial [Bryobacteraceae bacterium]|nr:hypothetical protein [Bryobacteraceae bacterium]
MIRTFVRVSAFAVQVLLSATAFAAEVEQDYLSPKAYAEYPAVSGRPDFNTSGRPVQFTAVSKGVVHVRFEDLARFAVRPSVQVSPRHTGKSGIQTCGARLETEGSDLVAVVSCRTA